MNNNEKLIASLEQLTAVSEQYYKWANQFDLRIEDHKLRSAIAHAKSILQEVRK